MVIYWSDQNFSFILITKKAAYSEVLYCACCVLYDVYKNSRINAIEAVEYFKISNFIAFIF